MDRNSAFKLGIIVPCYNECEVLPTTHRELTALLDTLIKDNKITQESFILYCNDGSTDNTWELIHDFCQKDPHAKAISFAKNFGHQYALLAGMEYCAEHADCNVCIDADLQHDIHVIPEFIEKYNQGAELVFGIKKKRGKETLFKKITAQGYYWLLKTMGVNIIPNHADFRFLSRRATEVILSYRERNLFLRGLIPQVGFKQEKVYYDVKDRTLGTSKYSLKVMLSLAIEGITSFSIFPLRVISLLGLVILFLSAFKILDIFYAYLQGHVIPGWSSTVLPLYFFGGLQLLALGIIGEYIGKVYLEVKNRPHFIISQRLD